jgi:ABC-type multidrug transport system ATPase subunit
VAAIRVEGLAMSFGVTVALRPLDRVVPEGAVLGDLGANGAARTITIRHLLDMQRPSAGRAEIVGVDARALPAEAHRRGACVPGDANRRRRLTGGEVLRLLGRIRARVDGACRHELIDRLRLDPPERLRACSKGNRHKVLLSAALSARADLRIPDAPATGVHLLTEQAFPWVRRGGAAGGRRCSCPRSS